MGDRQADWIAAMRRGDEETAWAISDAVLASRPAAERDNPALPYHRRWVWDGRPFAGRPVLVRCYHGLGDTLQFVRYLPFLRDQAESVVLEAQPELLPLLASAAGVDRLIPFDPARPAPPAACELEIMELPHALRLPAARLPPPPYLQVRAAAASAGTIGLCWQAGGWDLERSIPAAMLPPVLADRPIALLQPGSAPAGLRRADPAPCPSTVAGTAALIAALDHVVTVDTMVAHLAGALGRPASLVLKHEADWRWGNGDTSVWYPTARLYRQAAAGDWTAPLAAIARALPPLA